MAWEKSPAGASRPGIMQILKNGAGSSRLSAIDKRRPDLLEKCELNEKEKQWFREWLAEKKL